MRNQDSENESEASMLLLIRLIRSAFYYCQHKDAGSPIPEFIVLLNRYSESLRSRAPHHNHRLAHAATFQGREASSKKHRCPCESEPNNGDQMTLDESSSSRILDEIDIPVESIDSELYEKVDRCTKSEMWKSGERCRCKGR
jgi:hypothetical protein